MEMEMSADETDVDIDGLKFRRRLAPLPFMLGSAPGDRDADACDEASPSSSSGCCVDVSGKGLAILVTVVIVLWTGPVKAAALLATRPSR